MIKINIKQKSIVRWAKLEMEMHGISFYKARKMAKSKRKFMSDIIAKRYEFKRE